ncbi:MAG: hypothetical protein E7029_01805 [Planctomycetaceae bacterium]|nr:hypothetical protein [Planctomycetaceae bacterium]
MKKGKFMFIEKIHLQNLASLKGKWTIDFTHPDYEEGIFAIMGPNGAGKSTIMDAICLALYGRTPRLAEFSGSQNEIMSKGTQVCLAEVTFRTAKGRFVSRWRHRKTKRKDALTPFSPSEMEFESLDGTIGSRKKQEVKKYVQEYVGLNFEQFTQSAMLAQFQFEKFLTSDRSERIAILETLTGTGYFENLAARSQKIVKDLESEIHSMNASLEQVPMLSPEELEAKRAEQQQRGQKKNELDAKIRKLEKLRAQMNQWQTLQEKIRQTAKEMDALEAHRNKFLPSMEKLEKAERAERILPQRKELLAVRQNTEEKQSELTLRKDERETLRLECTQLEEEKKEAETAKELLGDLIQESQPILLEIRGTDEILEKLKQDGSSLKEKLSELQEETRAKKEDFEGLEKKVEETECRLAEQREQAVKNGGLEEWKRWEETGELPILTEFYPFHFRISSLLEQLQNLSRLDENVAELQQQFAEKERLLKDSAEKMQQASEEFQAARKEIEILSEAFRTVHEQQKELVRDSERNSRLQGKLHAFESTLEARTQFLEERGQLESRKTHLDTETKNAAENRAACDSAISTLREQIETLREIVSGAKAIREFESMRSCLHDGKPCPLCGALVHPYALNRPDDGRKEESELKKLQNELTEMENARELAADKEKELLQEKTRCETQLDGNETALKKCEETLHQIWDALRREWLEIHKSAAAASTETAASTAMATASTPELADILEECTCRQFLEMASEFLRREHQKSEEAEERRLTITDELTKAQNRYTQAEELLKEKETLFHKAENVLTGSRERVEYSEAEQRQIQKDLAEKIPALQADILTSIPCVWRNAEEERREHETAKILDIWKNVQTNLEQMYGAWELIRALTVELERQKREKEAAKLEFERAQNAQNEQNELLETCRNEFRLRNARRTESLNQLKAKFSGTKLNWENSETAFDATVWEEDVRLKYEKLQNIFREISENLEKKRQMYTRADANVQNLEKSIQQGTQTAERLHAQLTARIQEERFADEEELLRAVLPEEERQILESEMQKIHEKKSELTGRAKQNQQEFDSFGGQAPSDKTKEELDQEQERLKEEADENLKQMGILEQIFVQQKDAEEQRGRLNEKLKSLTSETQRWRELMNVLYPAHKRRSDSFVNFVQGFTFNRLVHFANIHLQQLNPRYLLRMHPEESTVLQIIDCMHEQSVRKPESLSGGETFILSLALALGLTRLASRNVEINSFFIDEGFGSLSQDSLKEALDALSRYHADAKKKGRKLIGLISHVESIQEEVGTFIRLTPYPPQQFSRISGPGVTQDGK